MRKLLLKHSILFCDNLVKFCIKKAYIRKVNAKLDENLLIEGEFLEVFKSLKISNPQFLMKYMSTWQIRKNPLLGLLVIQCNRNHYKRVKLCKVTLIFKFGKNVFLINYTPISVLQSFSKILESIMYNRLFKYLTRNNLLFDKQLGFREGDSTKYVLIELVNRILLQWKSIYLRSFYKLIESIWYRQP